MMARIDRLAAADPNRREALWLGAWAGMLVETKYVFAMSVVGAALVIAWTLRNRRDDLKRRACSRRPRACRPRTRACRPRTCRPPPPRTVVRHKSSPFALTNTVLVVQNKLHEFDI